MLLRISLKWAVLCSSILSEICSFLNMINNWLILWCSKRMVPCKMNSVSLKWHLLILGERIGSTGCSLLLPWPQLSLHLLVISTSSSGRWVACCLSSSTTTKRHTSTHRPGIFLPTIIHHTTLFALTSVFLYFGQIHISSLDSYISFIVMCQGVLKAGEKCAWHI